MRGIVYGVIATLVFGCTRSVAPPRLVAAHYEGPIQSRDIAEGGRIYLTLCTACHQGRVNPGGYRWSPGQMRQQIREGNRLMPPILPTLLDHSQVEAVLAYLSQIHAIDGALPPPPSNEPEHETLFPEDDTGDALDAPALDEVDPAEVESAEGDPTNVDPAEVDPEVDPVEMDPVEGDPVEGDPVEPAEVDPADNPS